MTAPFLPDIVLLSTAEWDNPFWTNKQHVATELARRGYRTLYIDSLGIRRPSATGRDLSRILKRIARGMTPPRRARDSLWIWSPIVLPWQDSPFVRLLNRILLRIGLALWMRVLKFKWNWLWTYSPLTGELLPTENFQVVIYHCVDEIKSQPGMPVTTISRVEPEFARQADIIFATSPSLATTRRAWNPNTHYFPNVADFDHFSTALASKTPIPRDIEIIATPRIGFIGAISAYKLDFSLIRGAALLKPDWSWILIGKVGEGEPATNIQLISDLPNVHLLGPRPYASLPGYLKSFDVAVLPNDINEYTDAMFPMKFFEYLAAGKPVVSTPLKAIHEFSSVVSIAAGPAAFVTEIANILAGKQPDLSDRLATARNHTYASRTGKMLDLINLIWRERAQSPRQRRN